MSVNNSKLDKSYGATSGDGSMIKSWISIKDIKRMIAQNKPKKEESLHISDIAEPTTKHRNKSSF